MPKKPSRPVSAETKRKQNKEKVAQIRSDTNYRNEERERDKEAKRCKRSDSAVRASEQAQDTAARQVRRSNPTVRANEQAQDTAARQIRRSNPTVRANEQAQDTAARQIRRSNPTVRANEQAQDTAARQIRRSNPTVRASEQAQDTAARQVRRSNPTVRANEQAQDTAARQIRRNDPTVRANEQAQNTAARQVRRNDPAVRASEQAQDTAARQVRRNDPAVRASEQVQDTAARRVKRNQILSWIEVMEQYFECIKEGPTYNCYSCDRLWFKKLKNCGCTDTFIEEVLLEEFVNEKVYQFCSTCYTNIRAKKYPRFNINKSLLAFPKLPDIITSLTPLEERLVATRIPFMKIFALGVDRQFGLKSGVINIPVDVPKMFKTIPIKPEQSGVIHLKLKRRIGMQNHYLYERIRPAVVYEAGKILVQTPLYIKEGINLDESWQVGANDIFNSDSNEAPMDEDTENQSDPESETQRADEEVNQLYEETLLDANEAIEFAPGEGQIPVSILTDINCEELSFPTIYFGHERVHSPNVKLSYEDHVNSEIRRRDRRAVRADHLLFMHKKSQLKQLCSNVNIALKKCAQSSSVTASQILNSNFVDESISKDNAYRFLTNITGSPAYWEQQKKNVMAMVRQLGVFTLFVTLSAAETHWKELLRILKKTVDNEDDADVTEMDFEEKSRLIRTDPVTCSLYFDHKFKELFKTLKNTNEGPFGKYKILQHYYRIEFQHRGSPHVHMILWLNDAPTFDADKPHLFHHIEEFIDNIISTSSDDPNVQDFVKYQYHKCSRTCKKKTRGNTSCRFGAPFIPMDKTRILQPLSSDYVYSNGEQDEYHTIVKNLNELLSGDLNTIGTFEELLVKLNCDRDKYIKTIRSQLKATKILIRRAPKDARVNPYASKILMLMQSNIDVQFVLDPYACIGYIVEYINKPSRGISRLLRACVEEFRSGNYSLREKIKKLSYTYYNGTEISAQEAAWCRLRLPMSHSSSVVEFINTGPMKTRHRILKSQSQIKKLPENSTDVYKKGSIDRYKERPEALKDVCLADFIAKFSYKGKKSNNEIDNENVEQDDHLVESIDNNQNEEDESGEFTEVYEDESGEFTEVYEVEGGTVRKRKQIKIIRFCRYDFHKDPNNFYRERLMLFKPWRDESLELEKDNLNLAEIYTLNKQLIESNSSRYIKLDIDLNDIARNIEEEQARDEDESNDQNEDQDQEQHLNVYDFDDNILQSNETFGIESVNTTDHTNSMEKNKITVPDLVSDQEYYELVNSLNTKQNDHLMHVLNAFKLNELPLYHFVSGEAGVGKSRLIKAVYQTLMRHFNREPGPIDTPEILIIAYTGKAAHNVNGLTAHAAFSLVLVEQGTKKSDSLSPEVLNTLRVKLKNLKLIIIDEISMMGITTFEKINKRLMQVFQSKKEFGGRSVITLGDFQQLQPVRDNFVFARGKNDVDSLFGNSLWDKFKHFELTEIMRQKDDLIFAQLLGRLAKGALTQSDIDLINTRIFVEYPHQLKPGDKLLPAKGKDACRLIWQNKEVDSHNLQRIMELRRPETVNIRFRAIDNIIGATSETDKRQVRFSLQQLSHRETQGLATELVLQKGIRYMITSNIDVTDGLYNGGTGELMFMEFRNRELDAVYLKFDDPTIGRKARAARRAIMAGTSAIDDSWTPITRIKLNFRVNKCSAQVFREQYPIVPAEAISIHKSQGSTLENVTILLVPRMSRSLIYVACSRAKTLDGLYLIGKFKSPTPPRDDHPVVLEMKRLRETAQLIPKFQHLKSIPANEIQIVSFNFLDYMKY
ncbi:unnamed protein product [Chironomus riparius]|uniref:ATP-dependent DNA helicase n=1 Tax=Chironomus riparius TaxID=315576 RepID=A0A9N9WWA4_9DIPT|nr:unnamed protein product [Chironomus riparius]